MQAKGVHTITNAASFNHKPINFETDSTEISDDWPYSTEQQQAFIMMLRHSLLHQIWPILSDNVLGRFLRMFLWALEELLFIFEI